MRSDPCVNSYGPPIELRFVAIYILTLVAKHWLTYIEEEFVSEISSFNRGFCW